MGLRKGRQKKESLELHLSIQLAFGPHNCDATFSSFSVNFSFTNNRLPGKGRSGIRNTRIFILLFRFWRWRSANLLVYIFQCYISMSSGGFNEGKRVGHRRRQLCGRPYVRLLTCEQEIERLRFLLWVF